jgi:hypothetical protein
MAIRAPLCGSMNNSALGLSLRHLAVAVVARAAAISLTRSCSGCDSPPQPPDRRHPSPRAGLSSLRLAPARHRSDAISAARREERGSEKAHRLVDGTCAAANRAAFSLRVAGAEARNLKILTRNRQDRIVTPTGRQGLSIIIAAQRLEDPLLVLRRRPSEDLVGIVAAAIPAQTRVEWEVE